MDDPLAPDQLRHIYKLCHSLDCRSVRGVPIIYRFEYPVAIDTSQMGCGKTRTAHGVARCLGVPIFVVRPGTVDAWEVEAEMTGVELVESIGYERLRSKGGKKEPDHRWLTREDIPVNPAEPRGEKRAVFTATAEWLDRVKKGVLLVADEAHNLKNLSDKSAAVQELIRVVVEEWDGGFRERDVDDPGSATLSRSRVLLLSGSLFDKPEHATRMCEVMGLLPAGERNPETAWRTSRSAKHWGRLMSLTWSSWGAFETFVWKDFTKVVMGHISSSMPLPDLSPWTMDMAMGFYRMSDADLLEMEGAVDDLVAAREDGADGGLGAITEALKRAHRAKVDMTVRLVGQWMDSDPNAQAVVFGWFKESLDSIVEQLSRFNPLLFTGKTLKRDRSDIVARFQSGERKLIVANMKVGGVGLNMQDLHGNRPRRIYMLPTYFATDMLQAAYRCYRRGVKSHVVVRVLFAQGAEKELQLLANMQGKGKVWQELMPAQVEQGKKFLEDNPHVEETDDGSEVPRGSARLHVEEWRCADGCGAIRGSEAARQEKCVRFVVRCRICRAAEGTAEWNAPCEPRMEVE